MTISLCSLIIIGSTPDDTIISLEVNQANKSSGVLVQFCIYVKDSHICAVAECLRHQAYSIITDTTYKIGNLRKRNLFGTRTKPGQTNT